LKNKKKLCLFIGFYPFAKGGAEYQCRIIADHLKQKYDIFFISYEGVYPNTVNVIDGYKIYSITPYPSYNRKLLYFPVAQTIFRILEKEKPDIIYQRILNSFSYHLSKYSKNKKIPYFIHVADNYSLQLNQLCLTTTVRKWMLNKVKKNEHCKFIIQTSFQKKLLEKQGIRPLQKVYNMHPFDKVQTFEKYLCKKKKGLFKVLWIGSARPVKRMNLFLDLAELFKNENKFSFHIIGRIEKTNTFNEELIKKIEKNNTLHYHGEQSNDYVNKEISTSNVIINTSLNEGFSNVFIQAWLRGVPVISLNSNPDELFNKYNLGYFCDNNFDKLVYNLKKIEKDKDVYIHMAEKSYNVSRQLFNIENNIHILKKSFQS